MKNINGDKLKVIVKKKTVTFRETPASSVPYNDYTYIVPGKNSFAINGRRAGVFVPGFNPDTDTKNFNENEEVQKVLFDSKLSQKVEEGTFRGSEKTIIDLNKLNSSKSIIINSTETKHDDKVTYPEINKAWHALHEPKISEDNKVTQDKALHQELFKIINKKFKKGKTGNFSEPYVSPQDAIENARYFIEEPLSAKDLLDEGQIESKSRSSFEHKFVSNDPTSSNRPRILENLKPAINLSNFEGSFIVEKKDSTILKNILDNHKPSKKTQVSKPSKQTKLSGVDKELLKINKEIYRLIEHEVQRSEEFYKKQIELVKNELAKIIIHYEKLIADDKKIHGSVSIDRINGYNKIITTIKEKIPTVKEKNHLYIASHYPVIKEKVNQAEKAEIERIKDLFLLGNYEDFSDEMRKGKIIALIEKRTKLLGGNKTDALDDSSLFNEKHINDKIEEALQEKFYLPSIEEQEQRQADHLTSGLSLSSSSTSSSIAESYQASHIPKFLLCISEDALFNISISDELNKISAEYGKNGKIFDINEHLEKITSLIRFRDPSFIKELFNQVSMQKGCISIINATLSKDFLIPALAALGIPQDQLNLLHVEHHQGELIEPIIDSMRFFGITKRLSVGVIDTNLKRLSNLEDRSFASNNKFVAIQVDDKQSHIKQCSKFISDNSQVVVSTTSISVEEATKPQEISKPKVKKNIVISRKLPGITIGKKIDSKPRFLLCIGEDALFNSSIEEELLALRAKYENPKEFDAINHVEEVINKIRFKCGIGIKKLIEDTIIHNGAISIIASSDFPEILIPSLRILGVSEEHLKKIHIEHIAGHETSQDDNIEKPRIDDFVTRSMQHFNIDERLNVRLMDSNLVNICTIHEIGYKTITADNEGVYIQRGNEFINIYKTVLTISDDSEEVRGSAEDNEPVEGKESKAEKDLPDNSPQARSISTEPAENAESYLIKANNCIKLKQYDKALTYSSRAIDLDPSDVEAYICKSRAYLQLEKFDDAYAISEYVSDNKLSLKAHPFDWFSQQVNEIFLDKSTEIDDTISDKVKSDVAATIDSSKAGVSDLGNSMPTRQVFCGVGSGSEKFPQVTRGGAKRSLENPNSASSSSSSESASSGSFKRHKVTPSTSLPLSSSAAMSETGSAHTRAAVKSTSSTTSVVTSSSSFVSLARPVIKPETIEKAVNSYNKAIYCVEAKDYLKAVSCLDEAVLLHPNFKAAFKARANCHVKLGNESQAQEDFAHYNILMKDLSTSRFQGLLLSAEPAFSSTQSAASPSIALSGVRPSSSKLSTRQSWVGRVEGSSKSSPERTLGNGRG
jgi:tetratricopeptide (TPR) repeat protein